MGASEKDAAWTRPMDAAKITSMRHMDPTSKDAAANMHLMVAALMARLPQRDTTMKVVAASIPTTDVAQMKQHLQLVQNTKAAHAIHSNSDAAAMESPLPPDHTIKAATARTASSNAVLIISPQPRDRMPKDAHALPANSDVAQTDTVKPKETALRDAKIRSQTRHRRLAVLNATWELAATTTPSSTSSTLNTAVAVVSGMEDVAETLTVSTLKASARTPALNHPARTFATCPRSTDHAQATTQCGITTATETHALSLSTVVASVTPTDSRRLKTARHSAVSTTKFVSV